MPKEHSFDQLATLVAEEAEAIAENIAGFFREALPPGYVGLTGMEVQRVVEMLLNPEATPVEQRVAKGIVGEQFERAERERAGPPAPRVGI